MKTMAVGELKAQFSTVLTDMKDGQYRKAAGRRLGILEGQATCRVRADFSLSDEDVLSS